jgi:putative redox protein
VLPPPDVSPPELSPPLELSPPDVLPPEVPSPAVPLLPLPFVCSSSLVPRRVDGEPSSKKSWSGRRDHSRDDCTDCETESGWIDQIDLDVELSGELDDAQRQRLIHIAELCPVHRTLTSEVRIVTPQP